MKDYIDRLDIQKIVVFKTDGTDEVSIYTNLPSPFPKEVSEQSLRLSFHTAKSWGVRYVEDNFPGIPVEVLDISSRIKMG